MDEGLFGTPPVFAIALLVALALVIYVAEFAPRSVDKIQAAHPEWSHRICELVAERTIQTGMTEEMVRASWGGPTRIHRSVGSWGVHEQWVYGTYSKYGSPTYLYFENGRLTSWQT
ncbi:hypothetical protein KAU37_11375 [Candidatus Bipolaricaulota bacterium]|nr:hypothetical protein [Candidatus Bipolaricaulota bacterium]